MQSLWIGLEEVIRAENLKLIREPEAPRMSLAWNPQNPGSQIIARTIARSLEEIAKSYPRHVKYDETEE
jgi:uncharacterized protein YsxB (DUF464 family)